MIDSEQEIKDLEDKLLNSCNQDEMNNIIELFNVNIKKKDIIRNNKLNELQDKITSQITERIDKKANEFSNKDLLDYFKVIQDTINKSNTAEVPTIQINQQNINMEGTSELNKESRDKINNAITSILAKYGSIIDDNIEEIIDEEDIIDESTVE